MNLAQAIRKAKKIRQYRNRMKKTLWQLIEVVDPDRPCDHPDCGKDDFVLCKCVTEALMEIRRAHFAKRVNHEADSEEDAN